MRWLGDLRPHNLITYKSYQEALNDWAIDELIGHYVSYRKSLEPRPPVDDFGLYAICTRQPQGLISTTSLEMLQPGVYVFTSANHRIKIIVLSEVPLHQRNALWDLFSHEPERIRFGMEQYQWRQPNLSSSLRALYQRYQQEGLERSYTIEDFREKWAHEILQDKKLLDLVQWVAMRASTLPTTKHQYPPKPP